MCKKIWPLISVLAVLVVTYSGNSFGADITISTDTSWPEGVHEYDNLTVDSGATLSIAGGSTVNVPGTLTVTGTSTILLQGKNTADQVGGQWAGAGVTIHAGNVQVDTGSKISADGQGYETSKGPGAGPTVGDGGSYGGRGGANSGPTYGSGAAPADLGSAGGSDPDGWSRGGGAIRLIVSGTLSLNGDITASGTLYTSWWGTVVSGGSGGSIYVTAGTLTGSGKFTANGAPGPYYGVGGGGGRIGVYYAEGPGFSGFVSSTAAAGPVREGYALAGDGTVAFFDTSVPNYRMSVFQRFAFGEDTSVRYGGMSLSDSALLEIGGGSWIALDHDLEVTGGSTILLHGKYVSRQSGGRWAGSGVTIHAENVTVDGTSKISADGEGYTSGQGPGAGPTTIDGGSHGGRGGNYSGPTYGSAMVPTEPGSGGGSGSDGWSHGGGVIRLNVADTLTLDGEITADGMIFTSWWGAGVSGGAGGAVLITARDITGLGTVTASGGPKSYYGTTGGGGRIAIHYWGEMTLPTANVTATSGGSPAEDGTAVINHTDPLYVWADSTGSLFHDTERLAWEALAVDPSGLMVEVIAFSEGTAYPLAEGLAAMGELDWDTRGFPDGLYELRAAFRNGSLQIVGEAIRSLLVNNSVIWHSGRIESSETWHAGRVHVVEGDVTIPPGVTLTIEPGAIVKFADGTGIMVDGGTLDATATSEHPIVFTSLADDTVGGDTNMDGEASLPIPGTWNGISLMGAGQLILNDYDSLRFIRSTHAGAIASSEVWFGTYVHHVTGDLTIAAGGSVTIQPGAVVKLDALKGIVVQTGGSLVARGTVAEPIYMTSIKDDSLGGDSNRDGNATTPGAGDWRWIYVNGGEAVFDHVQMSYGGGTPSGTWETTGMIKTEGSATLTLSNSVLYESFFDGILAWGGSATLTNSILTGIDRAVCAHPGSAVQVINCTIDDNRIGLLIHGGTMDVANTIVTNSVESGVQYDSGTLSSIRYSNVWASAAPGYQNYRGISPDPTGTNGNLSEDPRYKNRVQGDYRLNFGSPCIDAADGTAAPDTDFMGAPRYSDPRTTPKRGIPDGSGIYIDMGAYEFVENADSEVDLVVSSVTGPVTAMAGETVILQWTVTNTGTGAVAGPWHDAVYLVRNPETNPAELFAGEGLAGQGILLGPGESATASGTVRVPGSIVAEHRWAVRTNVRGEVFEGQNTANNTTYSSAPVVIDLPELRVNGLVLTDVFSETGQAHWFKMTAEPGKDVQVSLDLVGDAGVTQLYIGQGYVPGPQRYDIRQQEWNRADVSVLIPGSTGQTYYLTAYAASLTAPPATFSIGAAAIGFSITSVGPAVAGNGGKATIRIEGGELSEDLTYELVDCQGGVHSAESVYLVDSSLAYVTFDLTGQPVCNYSVRVTKGPSTATLADAVTVRAGSPGRVEARLVSTGVIRANGKAAVVIEYANVGDSDVMAPLFLVTADTATMRTNTQCDCFSCLVSSSGARANSQDRTKGLESSVWDGSLLSSPFSAMAMGTSPLDPEYCPCCQIPPSETVSSNQLYYLGISREGPAGILPPGAGGSVVIEAFPTGEGQTINYTLRAVANPDEPVNWSEKKAVLRPYYVSAEAWDAIFANFLARVGSTIGQYNAVLAENATALSRLGDYTDDASSLMYFILGQCGLGEINERYLAGAFGRGRTFSFDVWGEMLAEQPVFHYASGQVREFFPDGSGSGQFTGVAGDYVRLVVNSGDRSWDLIEPDGTLFHLSPNPPGGGRVVLDYSEDRNGNRATFSYTSGRLTGMTDENGGTTTYEYNTFGRITRITDAVGRATVYTYDASGEHLLSFSTLRGTTQFTYVSGQGATREHALHSVVFPDGTHSFFEYDEQGRLIRTTRDGGTEAKTYAYDGAGGTTITDALGARTRLFLNRFSQTGRIIDPLGRVREYGYDRNHRLVSVTGEGNTRTSMTYDGRGNRIGLNTPASTSLSASFDEYGKLATLVDPRGNATRHDYDSGGNLSRVTYADGSIRGFEHDGQGRTVRSVNRRGQTIQYTVNSLGLTTRKEYPDGSTVDFTYDGHGNLASASDVRGTISFTYDGADLLTRIDYPGGRFLSYTYDSAGRRIGMTAQDGFNVGYLYDGLGRLSGLVDGSAQPLVSYTYDPVGRLSRKDMGNGSYATYEYDAAGHLLHLVNYGPGDAVLSRFDYTYDSRGLMTRMTTLEGDWNYTYDVSGQLTGVATPGGRVLQYAYDASGNRTAVTDNGVVTEYQVNPLDEITSAGPVLYHHDPDGNLISRETVSGTWTYVYDAENRMVGINGPTDSWNFEYDALGNRVATVSNGTRREYLHDVGNVIGEYDGTGGLVAHYAHGLGLVSRFDGAASASFYHYDGSANTAQISGPGGGILNTYSYLPFGERLSGSETVPNPFTFVGQFGVMNDGTGLYFMQHRYYDPAQGRFVQPDPIGLAGREINLYRYAGNIPNLRIDPSGLLYSYLANSFGELAAQAQQIDPNNPDQVAQWNQQLQSHPIMAQMQHYLQPGNPVFQVVFHFAQQGQHGAAWSSLAALMAHIVGGVNYQQAFQHFQGVYSNYAYILDPHMYAYYDANGGFYCGLGDLNDPAVQNALAIMESDFENYLNQQCNNPPPPPDGPCVCPAVTATREASQILDKLDALAGSCTCTPLPPVGGSTTQIVGSFDPNVKITVGYGNEGFIGGDGAIVYTIDFENQSSATAPAQKVVVTDQLSDSLDWSTVELLGVGFNNVDLNLPPGLQQFEITTLVATDPNPVRVRGSFDGSTGILTWTMQSVDPVTGGLPEDPLAGFLPPNNATHRGEGYVSFLVRPKPGLVSGTAIQNQATIVFDVNAPINTGQVLNTIDDIAPSSTVNPLPASNGSTFAVNWTGSDQAGGSGISFYNIYVSIDSGVFVPWLVGTTQTSAVYSGTMGHAYGFYSVATDNVGNRETPSAGAQATTNAVCTYGIPSGSRAISSTGGTDSFSVMAAPGSCTWIATTADSWITITSGGGTGNGTVDYHVDGNTTGAARTGTITIGVQTVRVMQAEIEFGDVLSDHWASDFIYFLYLNGVTGGCGNGDYCPDNPVTRAQMAVFIVSAMGETPSTAATNAYFDDVAEPYAGFINRMSELGIAAGCGDRAYCPNNLLTRAQMAVFIIAAMGETGSTVAHNANFDDIDNDVFAGFINRMTELGITGGCGDRAYCPGNSTNRAMMAVFLVTAF